jgi:hypothetical protein
MKTTASIQCSNSTRWDDALVLHLVGKLSYELKLRKPVQFLFQDEWTEINVDVSTGEILPGEARPEITWDGDAWGLSQVNFVRICLSPQISFPLVWDINPALPGGYLRRATWFNDQIEMFVYLAAHEFRHLWQFEHEAKLNQICKLLQIDDEGEADIYALRTLSLYRQNPQAFAIEDVPVTSPTPLTAH